MSDDDKSMDVQLICNQLVVIYNKLLGINPMGLSDPWVDYKNKQIIHRHGNLTKNLMM